MIKQIWLIFSLILIFMTAETGFSQDQDGKEIKDENMEVLVF
jgi:hypothetical protein